MANSPRLVEVTQVWSEPISLSEVGRGALERRLEADEAARARIAEVLGLDGLLVLNAHLRVDPWLDGVEISGGWTARVVQTCGVTLELFESDLAGRLAIRAAPLGSPTLGTVEEHEIELDPEADDPPDVLTGGVLDLGAYVVEDLSLAIDPFPRKPGAAFEAPQPHGEISPFAVLAKLKGQTPDA